MADSVVRIGLVLPDVMGTYGDGGNAVVLRQRLLLRGIAAEIVEITLADPVPDSLDLYTLGGAEDYAQRLATRHLRRYPGLQRAAGRGAPVLAICAAIQVLGHWYETSSGDRVDGVGLLDVTTSPQDARTIGELVSKPLLAGLTQPLTGFENHRGGTYLEVVRREGASWVRIADDGDWATSFRWQRQGRAGSHVSIRWDVPGDTTPGQYRIVHHGTARDRNGMLTAFSATTREFTVV